VDTVYELGIFHAEEERSTPSTKLEVGSVLNVTSGANIFMLGTVKIKPVILFLL
jgi:hypothetical protein